jgi:formylglycine-generating enzyme required for sulfatase activity
MTPTRNNNAMGAKARQRRDHRRSAQHPASSRLPWLAASALLLAAGLVAAVLFANRRPKSDVAPQHHMILIPGGTFRMGDDAGLPHERPAHDVTLKPFWIDKHEVTVAQFRAFNQATGYKTEAEEWGWSAVFDKQQGTWVKGDGATWRHPHGPTGPTPRDDEPVTQVSWNDAAAYAKWANLRLPTEAEFECAARGGLVNKPYSWGDDLRPNGKPAANWWQGTFPNNDTAEDGYAGLAPVAQFPPNGYGLHDMTGNVWEWCSDFYADDYFSHSPKQDPTGPPTGSDRVIRGGSFMCAENFCTNFRVAGRSKNTPDSANTNLGFRCARDANGDDDT